MVMEPFDVSAELPGVADGRLQARTTLLEASAGTGKTWTIAALITRYLADGLVTIDQILAVTFTNAATSELRDRVRTRLDEVATVLDRALAGHVPEHPDALVSTIVDGTREELTVRRDRLRTALASFDTATILTIHQFCHLVLKGLGIAGDTDPRAQLVEDLSDLRSEVVDDLWLHDHGQWAADSSSDGAAKGRLSHADAVIIAAAVVNNPGARIEPDAPEPGSDDAARVGFARAVVREFDLRKRRLGVLSYDDLLVQLRDALTDSEAVARGRMRRRWPVVLIDEFQDTDPVQWEVFECAFHGSSVLVLIGDPKQAIYAFRGGDVFTYLRAAELTDHRQTLVVNQRSDVGLVDAVHTVLNGAQLGDPEITVHPIQAARTEDHVRGLSGRPFQLRTLLRADLGASEDKLATVGIINPRLAADAAAQVRSLLTEGAQICDPDSGAWRDLGVGDIAVLAHGRRHLEFVREALASLGIAAVITGGQSVFATAAGNEWRALLEAMSQPHRAALVRAAGATSFFGLTGNDLDRGGEELTDTIADRLREHVMSFHEHGIAAVFEAFVADGLSTRVLGTIGGERHLTDLRHLAELMHAALTRDRLGLAGMVAWFLDRQRETNDATSERTRRIDSDAAAVQLVTIHGSKGLEYPVVLAPFLSDRYTGREKPKVLTFHDDQRRRVVHVGDPSSRSEKLLQQHAAEEAGESLRLLYVACTRARSRLIAWWAAGNNAPDAALTRVMLGRGPDGGEVPVRQDPQPDGPLARWFQRWDEIGGPATCTAIPVQTPPTPPAESLPALAARRFAREIDQDWRRTSYSALAAFGEANGSNQASTPEHASHLGGVASEPEISPRQDEPEITLSTATAAVDLDVTSPLAEFAVGARFGSLVHAVLEHADPGAEDWYQELLRHCREQLVEWPVELDPEALATALVEVCDSPLGPLTGETSLRKIALADRLRELDFELPIGGGDDAVLHPRLLGEIAGLLRRHLPATDPLRPYATALDDPVLGNQMLVGYLTGSVDLVMRIRSSDGSLRYVICDYKTNWLGERDEPLTAGNYTPPRLAAAMGHSSYPLQALLYAVVLHRF
ncbi:MAG: UvrD-helicase domain-containing protein, partial [Nocardioidaceae bacterium]|nr:UvrD-helicase domain-containing protein [Nocardioidaceae bacterium]